MEIRALMRKDVVTVSESDGLALALQLMAWNGIRHLPVERGGRVVGMLSAGDLVARLSGPDRLRVDGTVRQAMSEPVQVVPPTMEIEDVAAIMVRDRIDALPVVETGELRGIVTSTDLLGHLAQCEVSPYSSREPTVGTLMIRRVDAVFADHPLADAAARMAQRGVRHLPVIDGLRRVTGILSERDVRQVTGRRLLELTTDEERSRAVARLRVSDAMTPDPRTIDEDAPLSDAVRALVEDRIGALPVIDAEERLCGILSYVDLVRYLGARLGEDTAIAARSAHR